MFSKIIKWLRPQKQGWHSSSNSCTAYNAFYTDGEIHRIDGPAVIWPDIDDGVWFLYGKAYTFDQWLKLNTEISGEQKIMLKLQYG